MHCSRIVSWVKLKRNKLFYAVAVIMAVGIAIALPFAMDWLIIGNDIPSNISNSDWVSFFGGYLGALLGAAASLFGIIITIRYTNVQNKLDRELQIRPYCSIRYIRDNKLVGTNKILGAFPLVYEPVSNNGPEYSSILYFKNIGLGPAIDFDFEIEKFDDGRDHCLAFMSTGADISNRLTNSLAPGDEAAFTIHINFNFDPITKDAFIDTGESGPYRFMIKENIMKKYKDFNIVIDVKYKDMFQNEYRQRITLATNMYIITENNEEKIAHHKCDLNVREITAPEKVANE